MAEIDAATSLVDADPSAAGGVRSFAADASDSGWLADVGAFRTAGPEDYVVGPELARGGMGRIVKARDVRHRRDVALKELLRRDEDSLRRFLREAEVAASL